MSEPLVAIRGVSKRFASYQALSNVSLDVRAGQVLCLVGAYSLSNSILDLWVLVIFGVFGYVLRKVRVDPSPMVVALVLGPMMEKTLRQALFLTRGSVLDLVARPLSATILILAAAALFGPPLLRLMRRGPAAGAVDGFTMSCIRADAIASGSGSSMLTHAVMKFAGADSGPMFLMSAPTMRSICSWPPRFHAGPLSVLAFGTKR